MDPPLAARLIAGALEAGPGEASIEITLMSLTPVRLPLHGVRLEATVSPAAVTDGRLGGAITVADMDAVLIPALADGMQAQLAECAGTSPNCCPEGSAAQTIVDLFDDDLDCAISEDELRSNDLLSSLFAPDVDLFDGDGNFNPRTDMVKDS